MRPSKCLGKLHLENSEQLKLGEKYAYRISLNFIPMKFKHILAAQPSEGLHLIKLGLYVHFSCNGYMVTLFYLTTRIYLSLFA